MPIDPDEVDHAEDGSRKLRVIRKKIQSISPAASQKGSSATSDVEQENKKESPGQGGPVSDADTEASEETKILPDKWLLTRDVLIRVHNKPRATLFTPK